MRAGRLLPRLFLLSFALTGVVAIASSAGCSSAPPEDASQSEADLTEADDDEGGEAEPAEALASDPDLDPDADPIACTAADPVRGTNAKFAGADPSAGGVADDTEAEAEADTGADGELASTEDAGEDESADEVDGIPATADEPFPLEATAEVMAAIPSKIKYVMVLIKENHTFDNYFTGFPGASSSTKAKLKSGRVIRRPLAPNGPIGTPCHSNKCGQDAYAGGAMDGFNVDSKGMTPFIRYGEHQIPNYWKYAREFVLADHMFSTTLGPSSPGHEVFWFGRSTTIDNPKCHAKGGCTGVGCSASKGLTATAFNPLTCNTKKVAPCFNLPSLPDHLPRGFSWMDYGGPMAMQIKSVASQPGHAKHFRKSHQLVADLKAGNIANLTIAHLSGGEISEHPPASPCKGENFTVDIVNAAMKLPQWKEMAIVVTWDDWGGFYDHVKPRVHRCKNGKIMENGFRLPLLVISPYSKKGHVLKHHTEQASVPRLVEELWGMHFMTTRSKRARDGIAGSLLGAFDFNQAPRDPVILTPRDKCP